MGSDDDQASNCNTGLSLGLLSFDNNSTTKNLDGHLNNNNNNNDEEKKGFTVPLKLDPAAVSPCDLSLGPLVDINNNNNNFPIDTSKFIGYNYHQHHHQIIPSSNPISPGSSSFSNNNNNSIVSLKRPYSTTNLSSDHGCGGGGDKELGGEDEVEGGGNYYYKVQLGSNNSSSTRVVISDEDEDQASPRKKLRLTRDQSAVLEDSFKENSTLNPNQKQALAKKLNLRPRQVEVWFQNRRARTKLKQTEMDCELLKKCCETLTEENKKLRKEIQELKSLKIASSSPSVSMTQQQQIMPVATLSICPTCERFISSGANSSPAAGPPPLNYTSGHHQYNHRGSSINGSGGGDGGHKGSANFPSVNGPPPSSSKKPLQLSFITRSSAAC